MPKKKIIVTKIIRKPKTIIKKKSTLIIEKPKQVRKKTTLIITKPKQKKLIKSEPIIITTKNNIRVVKRKNPLKQKSENWLQKTKFISSALDQVGSVYPIASFGAKIARMEGYGRNRVTSMHNNVIPINVSVPRNNNNVSKSTNYKSRALNVMSKYGKYAIPAIMVAGIYKYKNRVSSYNPMSELPSYYEEVE